MQSFTQSTGGDFQGSAQQVTTVVYGWGDINFPWHVLLRATTNTIFIFHFLVENRLSGGLVTNVHKDVFPLDLEPTESHVYVLLACCAAVILLLTEIRRPRRGLSLKGSLTFKSRILHCPAACTFEEERSKCSIWSLLFLPLGWLLEAANMLSGCCLL